jgi:hypothetical protein
MAINDGDLLTPGQKGWGGLGAHAIVFGKTPQETALITLGNAGSGSALFFLSAVNPGVNTFTFRASDLGTSIVDPASAKLTIDGQLVTLVASPKVLDATDFTYTRATPFAAGNHTYSIEVRDTQNQVVTDSGTFIAPNTPVFSAAQKATSVDTTKPGFIWNVFQNENAHLAALTPTEYLNEAELALAGQLPDGAGGFLPNLADPNATGIALAAGTVAGPVVRFEIPTLINLNQAADGFIGSFDFSPDDQMPGILGLSGFDDGIDAEIRTFVELPAGVNSLGISCISLFRAHGGYINSVADRTLLAEDLGLQNRTTIMKIFVESAGVYPIRAVYQAQLGTATIEVFSVKADGTKVLLNDVANGGLKAYRVGVVPDKGAAPITVAIQVVAGGQLRITWTEPGTVLQESTTLTGWTDLTTATSPYTPVTTGRNSVYYRLKK